MSKFLYIFFVLFFINLFNSNVKAASSLDVVACPTNANGEIVITSILAAADQTCDGEGASNLTINVYSLGFCTSAPTIRFEAGGKAFDERDSADAAYSDGNSDFSSCVWTIKSASTSSESLNSVGDVEPLPNEEVPPVGTYTHAVLVISNVMTVTGSATYSQTIKDTTEDDVADGNEGTKCWTNGSYFIDTGGEGPKIGTSEANAIANFNLGITKGGATCGNTPSPSPNTIISYYAEYQDAGACALGCNTTRSEEDTEFGSLTVLFTKADIASLATDNPTIQRSLINSLDPNFGTDTSTNTLTGVFAFNTPMAVTEKTTGIDIYLNFNNALSQDFETIDFAIGPPFSNDALTDPPRIRAIQSGPFGIQFVPVNGGSID